MSNYPSFSGPDTACPKCGDTADVKYMPAGTVFVSLADAGCIYGYGKGPEWLFRECFCGYGWPEQVQGAAPNYEIGQIIGALPPEPPVRTVLATQAFDGESWLPTVDRREDGWHLCNREGADPMDWRHVVRAFRTFKIVSVPGAHVDQEGAA